MLKAPHPYFGGKSSIAHVIWQRFGRVVNFIDPFCGSNSILYARPLPFEGSETVNDADGMITNLLRAIAAVPAEVARWSDNQVNECVPAGTMIATPHGKIPVEEINKGMVVLGFSEGKIVHTEVLATKRTLTVESLIQIGPLFATGNHPIWSRNRGYIEAKNFTNEDEFGRLSDDETHLVYLHADRSSNEHRSVCRGDMSKASIDRTSVTSDGRSYSSRLLDSFATQSRASSDLYSRARSNETELARGRAHLDSILSTVRGSGQSHGWRRGWAGVCANLGTSSTLEQTTERQEISSRTKWSDAWKNTFSFSSSKDKQRGERTQGKCGHKGPYGGSCDTSRSFAFYDRSVNSGAAREETFRGTQAKNFNCNESLSEVFNFQTVTGNYFANGVLVHNCDLHARHIWLVERKDSLQARLEGDPDYFDAKIAGWWLWGINGWIGSGWCSGEGPWRRVEVEPGVWELRDTRLEGGEDSGDGIYRKRVNRQLVHLGNAGQGVNRQRVHLGDAGQGDAGTGEQGLYAWMEALSSRLKRVRVCCGDFSRVLGPTVTVKQGLTAVVADPPYASERDENLYRVDSMKVAHDVREWCLANGHDPLLRIALCGYSGEHEMPGWERFEWKAKGGYAAQGDGSNTNCEKETIWFSPHCLKTDRLQQHSFEFTA